MLRMFVGMIIGSVITMMLLGGAPVADQLLANAQSTLQRQYAQSESTVSIYLLVCLALILVTLGHSWTKQTKQHASAIKKLRRYDRT